MHYNEYTLITHDNNYMEIIWNMSEFFWFLYVTYDEMAHMYYTDYMNIESIELFGMNYEMINFQDTPIHLVLGS